MPLSFFPPLFLTLSSQRKMTDKIYQAETELENARELRNWKELTEKLAKYASRFPNRDVVESLYNAERVFDV